MGSHSPLNFVPAGRLSAIMPSKENTYKSGSIGTENKKTVNSFRKQLRHEQWKSTPATISSEKLPIISRLQDDKSYTSVDEETPISEILWNILVGNPLNLMLIFVPFGIFGNYADWSSSTVFVLNALALVPLSALLGDFTEEVAVHTNPTVGGLINATFGNAFEVVVSIQALLADEYRIVQASVLGSVLSNLLLVLGCSIFFGGLKHKEQSFNSVVTTANMGLLGLCAAAFVLPTPFAKYYDTDEETALLISRIASVALMFIYCQLLLFQLVTHSDLLDDDDDDEEPEMPFSVSMACLAVITLVITELSDYMVSSIDGFCSESGLSRTFVGIIILPIVGNAVEHFTAVSVAMGGKMDLAMGSK